jgi:hypothetical protein
MSYAIGGEAAYYQPPAPPGPECQWCDGYAWVDVESIVDVSGNIHLLAQDVSQYRQHEIRCPRCIEDPGVEPRPNKEGP